MSDDITSRVVRRNARDRAASSIQIITAIVIVAVVAAILISMYANDLSSSRRTSLEHLRKLGSATMLYMADNHDDYYPHRFNCRDSSNKFSTCAGYLNPSGTRTVESRHLTGGAETRYYWVYVLEPYLRDYGMSKSPGNLQAFAPGDKVAPICRADGCVGTGYGGQNSYGHNDAYLSPAGAFADPSGNPQAVNGSSIPRIASTIMVVEASFYGAVPDVSNRSGLTVSANLSGNEAHFINSQGTQYKHYWKNIGGANWSFSGGEDGHLRNGNEVAALERIRSRYQGLLPVQFTDGHAKALPYQNVVGDICLWTTDVDGSHPRCN